MVSAGRSWPRSSPSGRGCELTQHLFLSGTRTVYVDISLDEQRGLFLDGLFMENNDRFQELEEKMLKVAEVLRQTREEKQARENELEKLREASQVESQQVADKEREIQVLKADLQRIPALERELQGLRREREDVRARVEKMIRQIDTLTKTDALG